MLQKVTIFFIFAKLVIIIRISIMTRYTLRTFNNMAKEIERKFLVSSTEFIHLAESHSHIRQTYLSINPDATVRLRIRDDKAYLTIKGRNAGAVRDEWEYQLPVRDAEEMADRLCGGFSIDKTRYIVDYRGWKWEIDLFHGRHEGLILAEIEMPTADSHPPLPPFVGPEVTGDPRYYNSTLSEGDAK